MNDIEAVLRLISFHFGVFNLILGLGIVVVAVSANMICKNIQSAVEYYLENAFEDEENQNERKDHGSI